jgi:hypothetical protein
MYDYLPSKRIKDRIILENIKHFSYGTLPGFITKDCFTSLINPFLAKLRDPTFKLLDDIYKKIKILGNELI